MEYSHSQYQNQHWYPMGQYVGQQQMAYHQNQHVAAGWDGRNLVSARHTDPKPRLAKDEVEQLEAEFRKNPKPNSNLKKALAEQMSVEVARINNWFQNRRAKAKQEKRTAEYEAKQRAEKERAEPQVSEFFGDSNHSDVLRPSSAPLPTQSSSNTNSPLAASPVQSPTVVSNPSADIVAKSIEDEDDAPASFSDGTSDFWALQQHWPSDGGRMYQGYQVPALTLYNDRSSTQEAPSSAHSSPRSGRPKSIAFRRNVPNPTPLGTVAAHYHPYSRKDARSADRSLGARRIASAGRVHKSSASSLNSYVEKSDLLLKIAQSGHNASSSSPPTPDTPAALPNPQSMREATAASNSSDEGVYNSIFMAPTDPLLTTPPTTPGGAGLQQNLFAATNSYGYQDSMGYDTNYALSMPPVSGYFDDSQPTSPSYAQQQTMGSYHLFGADQWAPKSGPYEHYYASGSNP